MAEPCVGGLRNQHGLTEARIGQYEIVIALEHRQLMPAVLALAQRMGPTAHRRHRWACRGEPFDKCRAAPQVVWLSAGGRGLWRLFEERFAHQVTGMLDLYHAAQNLWKAAAAWLDGRTTQARRWFGWARHRRWHGLPDVVLADLADAVEVEGVACDCTGHLFWMV